MSKKHSALPSQPENPKGLHAKYSLQKIAGYVGRKPMYVDPPIGAEYFVLRLDDGCKDEDHLRACKLAAAAYANAIEPTRPQMAEDMRKRYLNI